MLKQVGLKKINILVVKYLTKFCKQCQLYSKSPKKFKFTLKNKYNFNYFVLVNIFYLNNKLVLYIVNEAIFFIVARFLKDEIVRTV